MDVPTVYVDEPEDGGEARRQLARLLPQLTALFSLIAEATVEQDGLQTIYQAAVLGEELSEEAYSRADTLSDFMRPAAAPEEKQPAADTREEVRHGENG